MAVEYPVVADDMTKAAENVARHGWDVGQWLAAVATGIGGFLTGRRTAPRDNLVDVIREEGKATRSALASGFHDLGIKIDAVSTAVARIDGRTESRGG